MARKKDSQESDKHEDEGREIEENLSRAEGAINRHLGAANEKLLAMLSSMSELTRKRAMIEIEMGRISELNSKFEDEVKTLEAGLSEISAVNAELKSRKDGLAQSLKAVEKENSGMEKAVSKMEADVAKLEAELSENKKAAAELEKKKNRLAEDVDRLSTIKAEYMERIAKFKAMREELVK